MVDAGPAPGARRADARRNRDEILTVARAVLAEQGTQASLRDVARRAGVGLGTLYRHFPTRDALLETLLHEGFGQLVELAGTLRTTRSPAEALAEWLRALAAGSSIYRGLPSSLAAALREPGSALWASCTVLHDAGAQLLLDAQEGGWARGDVTGADMFALVGAVTSMTEDGGPFADRRDHLLSVVLDGLSAPARRENS
ncbi:TetR/AcrR family transcriptional regulator [Frankia sp. AgB1.9]|uniref:TetR/AcrR family transcriptional regulator n=1 Tax=unclassified Frankia TaxID=2632575 RepID=UPI0019346107|nr:MULTISPECIES: TetR/AcrR family transcriptional regulator [unclassified Frankia]MBL7489026.1 TetR/AcrR family transcriptional regulator [Frankia sp. AgW1.1]MBL7551486.1 TetR/AcrR family transcriptional regulator [Frankia sp. AgB1.9]MBL7617764.1 TetR/AcrR family transcriptional regulator [Frankia sp. AgB1.8]